MNCGPNFPELARQIRVLLYHSARECRKDYVWIGLAFPPTYHPQCFVVPAMKQLEAPETAAILKIQGYTPISHEELQALFEYNVKNFLRMP